MRIQDSFPCLNSLHHEFLHRFTQKKITIGVVDSNTGKKMEAEVPCFLFRGESITRPSTLSSMARIKAHSHRVFEAMPPDHHSAFVSAVEAVSLRAEASFRKWLKLDQKTSAGLAQHYGLPSELLDFSSSLEVALGFAVDDPSRWREKRSGMVAVLDVERAMDRAILADLTKTEWARRPTRQQAYGFFHRKHEDLKSDELAAGVGLVWYEVEIGPEEAASFVIKDLLDTTMDRAAGLFSLIADELATEDGGWPLPLAQFFARMLPATPLVMDRHGMMVARGEAGLAVDETNERELNQKLWSMRYSQPSAKARHEALLRNRHQFRGQFWGHQFRFR